MKVPALTIAAVMLSLPAGEGWAKGFELGLGAGWTAPTYEQTFRYDLGELAPSFANIEVQQTGIFELQASGALALGGGLTYYFNDSVGIEGRIDTVDFRVDTIGPSFRARVDLPDPLPDLSPELKLGPGTVDVERLFPVSLNLKARTRGRVRLAGSGGVSFLPRLRLTTTQRVGLGITELDALLGRIEIPAVSIQAVAEPNEQDEGRLGFNAGIGIEIDLSDRVALAGDLRGFRFPKQSFQWEALAAPRTRLEELLILELERQLAPIELEPVYFQAIGGVVLRF